MTEKLRGLLWIIAALLALYVWGNCRESAGASKQRLRDSTVVVNAHSHETDVRVARLAAESLELGGRLMRLQRNDSVARGEIVRLVARIPQGGRLAEPHPADLASADASVIKGTDQAEPAPPVDLFQQIAIRDTIIAQQDSVIQSQDSSLTIWRALAVERGDLLTRALSERDAYRKIAAAWQGKAGKHFGCAGGPAVVASLDGHVSAGVGIACGIRF